MDCNSIYANCAREKKKENNKKSYHKKICIPEIDPLLLHTLLPYFFFSLSPSLCSPHSHWGCILLCVAVSLHFNLENLLLTFCECACAIENAIGRGLSLSLTHCLALPATLSFSLSPLCLLLHSPFAYQLTARILISFQHCSSSAASLYQSPNPSCCPSSLASHSDNFVKNKISFLFQMPATTIKSESICKISKQKTEKQKRTLQFIRFICLLPFAFAFAYKSVRLYTRISHICEYIYSI